MPGRYDDDDDWPAAGGERLGGPIFEGGYFTSRYIRNIASEISTKYRLKPPEKSSVAYHGGSSHFFGIGIYEIKEYFVAGQKSRINNNSRHSTQIHC